jgi:ribonuclease HI
MVDVPEIYAFFDGACTGNGRVHAKAGFGTIFKKITSSEHQVIHYMNGPVEPLKYEFVDFTQPTKGLQTKNERVKPSNNRGEYLGFIWSLINILKFYDSLQGRPPVTIVSDSLLCIKTMNDWLPNRRKKNTLHELKNLDLVLITERLLNQLQSLTTVVLRHVRSHREQPSEKYGYSYICWKGNDQADRLATKAVKDQFIESPQTTVKLSDDEFDSL